MAIDFSERALDRADRRRRPGGALPGGERLYTIQGGASQGTQAAQPESGLTGTAELARRRFELTKQQREARRDLELAALGQRYYTAAGDLESNLESRGILRSGEAMRGRTQLGAEEKAAREATYTGAEFDINQAALDYANVLAELQAQNAPVTPAAPVPPAATPSRRRRRGGGNTGSDKPSDSSASDADTPADKSVPPKPLPTVGGKPVRPGDTPSETRGVPPRIVKPKPGGGGGLVRYR